MSHLFSSEVCQAHSSSLVAPSAYPRCVASCPFEDMSFKPLYSLPSQAGRRRMNNHYVITHDLIKTRLWRGMNLGSSSEVRWRPAHPSTSITFLLACHIKQLVYSTVLACCVTILSVNSLSCTCIYSSCIYCGNVSVTVRSDRAFYESTTW